MDNIGLNPPLPDAHSAPTPEFFEQLKRIHFLGIELSRIHDMRRLCHMAVVRGRQELGIDRLGLFLISEDRTRFSGTFGTDARGVIRDEHDFIGMVADDPFMLELVNSDNRTIYRIEAPLQDYRHTVGYGWNAMTSMWDEDQLTGILAADNLLTRSPLTTAKLELITLYTATLGHLIARRRTEQALREAEDENHQFTNRLRVLHEVSMELSQVDDLNELYRLAVEYGRRQLGFDRLALFLFDDTSQELVGTFGTDEHGMIRDERGFHQNIRSQPRVLEVLESRLFAKYWLETNLHDMGTPIGTGWNAMAMLWDGARGIGWLACDNLLRREPFRPYLIELLTLYGATLGHIITRRMAENARIDLAVDAEKLSLLRTFVSNVSHDFKTPLAVLNTTLYLLEHTSDPAKQQERVEVMRRHIEYLNRLIQDLLLISRLEHLPGLAIVQLNLNQLVEQAVIHFQQAVERKGLRLNVRLDAQLPLVTGAQYELYRVVTNLFENAINFSREGGEVTIATRREPASVHLAVTDTGHGIHAEDLAHLFDHYYRSDIANTYAQTGVGLGLAIVKRVIDLHQGSITVASEVGHGSTFEVALPINGHIHEPNP